MGRPKVSTPALKAHICGQAVCRIDGVEFYLGRYGSPQSLAKYAVLIREYQANGLQLPTGFSPETLREMTEGFIQQGMKIHEAEKPITVSHVAEAYRNHVKIRYANSESEQNRLLGVCKVLEDQAPNVQADSYGPVLLQEIRKKWIESGKTRQYCNRLTNAIVRVFKWAVSQELVDVTTHLRLKSVEPLRIGESKAPETKPVEPVPIEWVRATAKELPPNLRAAIRVQVATGARPGEVLSMRPCEIDRTQEDWMYRPAKHKNAKRGKLRAIPIVGDAKEAIIDYLNRDPDSYLFSPKESVAWWNAQKRAARKSKVQPSQVDRSDPSKTGPKPGDRFDIHSYRRAIERAAKRAGVPAWFPYQIRHLAATTVREALCPEAAQALLGHTNIGMTLHYAKLTEKKAIEAAKHAPTLGKVEGKS